MKTIAIVGNPNCGKTALFNYLTGGKQKVGNYPGVTVERKSGYLKTSLLPEEVLELGAKTGEFDWIIVDLPGTYSLTPKTLDEAITRDFLMGKISGEKLPDLVLAVADMTSIERSLFLVLELLEMKVPVVLALNMLDLAKKRQMEIDIEELCRQLNVPICEIAAIDGTGVKHLVQTLITHEVVVPVISLLQTPVSTEASAELSLDLSARDAVVGRYRKVEAIFAKVVKRMPEPTAWTDRIDAWVLHPFFGVISLIAVLGLLFQAMFNWAAVPADWIKGAIKWAGVLLGNQMGEGPLKSLVVDGIFAGVGSVLVFLPQILILYFFIVLLEDSGYMARAAFLMDRLMGKVGLHGRAFIPILSSYACAIPGIMATRTIEDRRDRLTTILIAPLSTCSARLPVYGLLISAFIPNTKVMTWLFGGLGLQGLVMLALYFLGIVFALGSGLILRKTLLRGPKANLLMELPSYKIPSWRNLLFSLVERAKIFLRRAGTVILSLSIVLWFLVTYPSPDSAALKSGESAIHSSYAGKLGHFLEPMIKPIGFDWRVGIALVPGFAAREVMVSALATVYAVENKEAEAEGDSTEVLQKALVTEWSLATALSLLMWYVIAPQCLSTVAVVRRETQSWKWPAFLLLYLTTFAYVASYLTFHVAKAWL